MGHDRARPVLDLALESIGDLYKFTGDFAGYATRWDARTTASDEGAAPPDRVGDFLVAPGPVPSYLYSIPGTDPRHVPYRSPRILNALKTPDQAAEYERRRDFYQKRFRVSELSMDEVAGLVGAYAIAFQLVDDPGTRATIRSQATKLGDYLAEHAYLLVRPAGGFTARGATGSLPAYEYPIVSALREITGTEFWSRVDFAAALDRAGYLRLLKAPITEWQVGGLALLATGIPLAALGGFLSFMQATAAAFGIPVVGPLALGGTALTALLTALTTKVGPHNVLRAIAIYLNRDCFDVWNDDAAGEVALASLYKEVSPLERFELWAAGVTLGIGGGIAAHHLPPLALSAVDGANTLVRDVYRAVVAAWRAAPPAGAFGVVSESPFTSALALLHSDGASDAVRGAEETKLVELLDTTYDNLSADLPLEDNSEEDALGSHERTNVIDQANQRSVLHYLAALGLTWLYERRRRDAGTPVETERFPVAPAPDRFGEWPAPTIPGYVVNRLEHVRGCVAPTDPVADDELIDVFTDRVQTAASAPVPPMPPPPTANFLGTRQVIVREADRDVYTGIDLQDNDEFAITATGEVRPFGIAGTCDPDGFAQLAEEARWPLHTGLDVDAHQFALLGSLGGYFRVGTSFPRTRFLYPESLPLYLRINDDNPGDGAGEFVATISLWGTPRPIKSPGTEVSCVDRQPGGRRIVGIGGVHDDGSRWRLPLDVAIRFVESGHVFRVGTATLGVARRGDRLYLRAAPNRRRTDNLGALPRCQDTP